MSGSAASPRYADMVVACRGRVKLSIGSEMLFSFKRARGVHCPKGSGPTVYTCGKGIPPTRYQRSWRRWYLGDMYTVRLQLGQQRMLDCAVSMDVSTLMAARSQQPR